MRTGRWDNWLAVAAGLALAFSWIWHGMQGVSGGALVALGLVVIMTAVISITRPGALSSEAGLLGSGAVAFALPWLLGFTHIPVAAWSAWIIGGVIILLGVYGLLMAYQARQRDSDLVWGLHAPG